MPVLSSLAPARRRVVLAAAALLVAVVVAVAALLALRAGDGDPVGDGPPGVGPAGPVVLVPGYGGEVRSLEVLAARLTAEGREVAVVPVPGDGTGDLRASADAVDAVVDGLLADGTSQTVDAVGYSAGGVVVRVWAQESADGRLRRAATLGSPHHGASVAGLAAALLPGACPVGCRQLQPGSDLLADLNAGDDEVPDGSAWTTVWSADDEVVTPPASARLAGATDARVQDVCADAALRHGQLPRDPLSVGLVVRALSGPLPPGPPSPADCAALRALGEVPAA